MAEVFVTDRQGDEHRISIESDISLMETIRNSGLDELLAICGGQCSCATCHVYVQTEALEELSSMTNDEHDLLECSEFREVNSRLSCQITLTEKLDGLSVQIAPEG